MSRGDNFNAGGGKHDQECYGCGATGNHNHFGFGRDPKCPYCGSGEVHFSTTPEEVSQTRGEKIDRLVGAGHGLNNVKVDDFGHPHVEYKMGNWIGRYKGGGIDISHASEPSSAVAFIQLSDFKNNAPKTITPDELHNHISNWVQENGEEHLKNL